jgi:tetratricopeptide (TPR) repeat protein
MGVVTARSFRRRVAAVLLLLFADLPFIHAGQQQPDPAVLKRLAGDGERALAHGQYGEAQKAYEALRQLSPRTAEVHARLGFIYFQQAKFTEAVDTLRAAVRLKPGLPNVDALLGMSLSELGRYDEALPAVKKAFSESTDAALHRKAGLHLQRIYLGLGRDADAAGIALRLSGRYPDDPEVLYHASRIFANLAYVQTMKLAEVAPDSVWLHQAAGEANESQGLYDAALREYRQVLAAAPKRPGIRFRIGRVLLVRGQAATSNGDLQEARQAFEDELALDPTNANAAYELAEMQRKAGKLESARKLFQQAVESAPAFDDALVGLARTLIGLGDPSAAIHHLMAALKHHPQNQVAYYQLAQAHRALGNTAEAAKALSEFDRTRTLAERRAGAVPQMKADVTPQTIDNKSPW